MKVIDLFSGCGGFSYGFKQEGFEILGFVECWEPAISTYLKNHPKALHLGTDITKVKDETISKFEGEVDIIVGGPPCQGFSIAGKRNPKDKRNLLYQEYLRFVRIIRPKYIVMENVSGILSMRDENNNFILLHIIDELMSLGYFVSYKLMNAAHHGVPQNRQRIIIIGKELELFPNTNYNKKSIFDAIWDLSKGKSKLNAHVHFNPSEETIDRIKKLSQGESMSNFGLGRKRLIYDEPSKTIVTKPIYIHPLRNRFLTPRELARIQSFPDSFEFTGSKTSMVKQIGNAVPPLMAKAIAKKIKEDIKNVK